MLNADFLGADSMILDLEDAVAPTEKDSARILVRNAIRDLGFTHEVIVRINPIDSPYWQKDLAYIVPVKPDMIMPTKSQRCRRCKDHICGYRRKRKRRESKRVLSN